MWAIIFKQQLMKCPKMFIAIVVSQKADDHDQFPSIINKAIEIYKRKTRQYMC